MTVETVNLIVKLTLLSSFYVLVNFLKFFFVSTLCTIFIINMYGWAKKVIPLVQCNICTRGITFLAHPV